MRRLPGATRGRRAPIGAQPTAALLLFLAAGCASRAAAPAAGHPPEPRAGALGFDPLEEEAASWRVGDRALFEVRYSEGEERRTWLVEVELLPLDEVPEYLTANLRYERDGREILVRERTLMHPAAARVRQEGREEARVEPLKLPADHLARGIYPSCELIAAWNTKMASIPDAGEPPPVDDAEVVAWVREFGVGVTILINFLRVIESSDELSSVLRKVVRTPSLLSLALNLGVDTNVAPDFERVRTARSPLPGEFAELPAFALPGVLELNGSPALEYELVCVPARPPLHVAGGVVRLDGRHPGRPERRVEIELVSARRGPSP